MKSNHYIKIPDLAVLLCNAPAGKAYLQEMLRMGYAPSKIIVLRCNMIKASDGLLLRLYKMLPTRFQLLILWAHFRLIKCQIPFNVYEDVETTLAKAGLTYEILNCNSINDKNVTDTIASLSENLILYTAGGLVKEPVFKCGKKILHIHPGYLPYVRGSNGLLWSILIRRRPGFTCFYMDAGIDTGDIIRRREFSCPEMESLYFLKFFPNLQITLVSLALEYFFDPYYRAVLLCEVIKEDLLKGHPSAEPQNRDEGETYYMMHKMLVGASLRKLGL